MPGVYKRRLEYVVAEALPAGGTVSGKNGITPVSQGDMQVGSTYYAASDFAAQFEPVAYEDCPEDLKAVSDPERYEAEQAAAKGAAEAAERRTARGERRSGLASRLGASRDLADEAEERRAEEEAGRVPTPEAPSTRDT